MGHVLTQQQVHTLEQIAASDGWVITSYTGRGMYNRTCLGVMLTAPELFNLGAFLYEQDRELGAVLMSHRCILDSMGRDNDVAYWPSVSVAGTSLEDDDQDDDE